MPNWKKVITSGSDAALNSLLVTNGITGSFSGSITAPGSTTQVIYNNGGVLGANSGFVYSGSNVGIGTNTPNEKLHVSGSGGTYMEVSDSTGPAGLKINATTGQDSAVFFEEAGSSIWAVFSDASTGDDFRIYNYGRASSDFTIDGSTGLTTLNNGIVINDGANNSDTRIEGQTDANLFFVDASTDRVGIGTNSPESRFHVSSSIAANYIARFSNTDTGISSNGVRIDVSNDSTNNTMLRMYNTTGWVHTFRADGNVGFGKTSPTYKLDVLGPDASTDTISWQNSGSRKRGGLYSDSVATGISCTSLNNAGIYLKDNVSIDFRVSGSIKALIGTSETVFNDTAQNQDFRVEGQTDANLIFVDASTDRVGIGTSAPSTKLHVQTPSIAGIEEVARFGISDDTNSYVLISNGTSTPSQFIPTIYGIQSSTRYALIFQGRGTTDTGTESLMDFSVRIGSSTPVATRPLFTWSNYTTEVMRINANGNVGIGTNSPSYKLDVSGSLRTRSTNILEKGYYSFTGTYTSTTETNKWQKVCSFGNPADFDSAAFKIQINEIGDTSGDVVSSEVYISYKHQSANYYLNANIINYGTRALTKDNFEIYLDSSSGFFTVYHRLTKNYTSPIYTYIGKHPDILNNYGTVVGATLSGETNNTIAGKYINQGPFSEVDTGYVGIGTTSPSFTLDVSGSTNLTGRPTVYQATSTGANVNVQLTNNSRYAFVGQVDTPYSMSIILPNSPQDGKEINITMIEKGSLTTSGSFWISGSSTNNVHYNPDNIGERIQIAVDGRDGYSWTFVYSSDISKWISTDRSLPG